MPFGELIREAFRIAARHRYLWPFGFFAGTSFGGNFNFRTGSRWHIDPATFHALAVVAAIPVEALRRGVGLVRSRVGESIALVMVQLGLTIGAAIVLWIAVGLLALPAILLIV